MQPWWLDAVAPGAWDEVTVEKGGQCFARMPYVLGKKRGHTLLTMPPLTQALGPWLRPYSGKYAGRLSEEKKLMTALIDQLPPFGRFVQRFHHSITNWLPFYWKGFQQTTRYTYVIEDLTDLEAVWEETRQNIRTDVRKAKKQVEVRTDLDVHAFLDLNDKTFKRQGLNPPYSRELVERLDQACRDHQCRRIFFAEDGQGQRHAAIYLVWDEQAAYYLMGGADPALNQSGATGFLIWEAIKYAATVTGSFDFEGSMMEPVERFVRAFGARQKPYFEVTRTNALSLKIAQDISGWRKLWRN